jgi:hypothetical protein
VVGAAREALEAGDVALVLPFVPERDEEDVRAAFTAVMPVRAIGDQARVVADQLFFETVVRIHRAGEGAPYTGLKPSGTPVSPVIPIAEVEPRACLGCCRCHPAVLAATSSHGARDRGSGRSASPRRSSAQQ